ncbi:kelch-like protein 36 isoform X3 [Branchiostoma floridae x Branchiostoma japonicum]
MAYLPLYSRGKLLSSLQHPQNVLNALHTLWEEELLCDVILHAEDRERTVHAHKAVLAACSSFFRELFSTPDAKERNPVTCTFEDVCHEVLEAIVEYMYTGHIQITRNTAYEIHELATFFDLKPIVAFCEKSPRRFYHPKEFRSWTHHLDLLEGLYVMRKDGICCDVVVVSERIKIPAHKIVLAAASDYFHAMFASGMRETHDKQIWLRDMEPVVLKDIIDFVYSSCIPLEVQNIQDVINVAHVLQCKGVVDVCCHFLSENIDIKNCADIDELAQFYGVKELEDVVDNFILRNFQTMLDTEYFAELPAGRVALLLDSNALQVNSEEDVFDVVRWWISRSPDRKEFGRMLLEKVRLTLIRRRDLDDAMRWFVEDMDCKDLWEDMQKYDEELHSQPLIRERKTQVRSEFTTVVAFGGRESHLEQPSEDVYFLNPYLGDWQLLTRMPETLTHQSAAVLNNFVYLVGGERETPGDPYRAPIYVGSVGWRSWRYDPGQDEWLPVSRMNTSRADFSLVAIGTQLYAAGGKNNIGPLFTVECFTPEKNRWEYVTPLREPRHGHAAVSLNDRLFLTGGFGRDARTKPTMWSYSPRRSPGRNRWISCTPMRTSRALHQMCTIGEKIFVAGGVETVLSAAGQSNALSVEFYDLKAETWTEVESMIRPQGGAGVAVLGTKMYLVGGSSWCKTRCSSIDKVQIYSYLTGRWSKGPCLPNDSMGVSCCVLTLPQDAPCRNTKGYAAISVPGEE